jgi:hypothetical protein
MLNVRYVVTRGSPKPGYHPLLRGGDYIVWENPEALPRTFVPKRVDVTPDPKDQIRRLSRHDFAPGSTALVEQPVELPSECHGSATITGETPQRVMIAVDMKTPGLIVLADRWDPGWKAYLDGKQVPILCTNHAVRGVLAPVGRQELQFRYEPTTVLWGSVISLGAIVVWLAWVALVAWVQRYRDAVEIDVFSSLEEKATFPLDGTGQQRGRSRKRNGKS